ncbi:hypothetical protein F5Y05DRAFT_361308 [Hypoxylon sp. FL0543]|nr:hypothetical protein F5Y05DRAFT_361308 [Hypoxylon sp. FL0543]
MSLEGTQVYDDGNWTLMYALLGATPIVFVAVALYSVWRDRATKKGNDFEMAAGQTFRRPRPFPWKVDMAISKPGRPTAPGPSYTRPPGRTGTRPSAPRHFSKPSSSSNDQNAGGRGRDRSAAQASSAEPKPHKYGSGRSEPSENKSKYADDFRDIPL